MDVVQMFFEALATPKDNITKEYLSGGMSDPCSIIDTTTTKE
jgi:hypothetical protein